MIGVMKNHLAPLLAGALAIVSPAFAAEASMNASAVDPLPVNFEIVAPDALSFAPIPDGLGAHYAIVHGDPSKAGVYVIRVRFPAGVMDRPHYHSGDRHVTVIEGVWLAGTGPDFDPAAATRLGPGAYMFHPAGGVHWDGAGPAGDAVVQIIGNGPVETAQAHQEDADWVRVDEAGAERR